MWNCTRHKYIITNMLVFAQDLVIHGHVTLCYIATKLRKSVFSCALVRKPLSWESS